MRNGKRADREFIDGDIAPRALLKEILTFVDGDVGALTNLPAQPSLFRKLDELMKDLAGKATEQPAAPPLATLREKRSPTTRSWTQPDLDNAIRKYKAERASTYGDLVAGVKIGKSGAVQDARRLFGRNAIARVLCVKARAMVSKSLVWQEIADELKLRGPTKSRGRASRQRIGMDIAIEEKAAATSEPVIDQLVRKETVSIVEKAMPEKVAETTIEKLTRGEISDDEARELADVYVDQQKDARARRIRQSP